MKHEKMLMGFLVDLWAYGWDVAVKRRAPFRKNAWFERKAERCRAAQEEE